ncbi:hypothetical protein M413DRAFT_449623 [Hebeloma cylindrosporum]|uniref:WW domain-containing protein n=1 Tax=Hebeloma cylindrosporum TaxID=76867 RepID=A0A0C2Y3M4_HEBCY|nr:hypothetical protein M413DRAFT_449623 [Hebeloma cylindrosporum h7]
MEKQGTAKFSPSAGALLPIVAQQTGRYDVMKKVQRSSCIIEPGKFLSTLPTYLPPQWSDSVHPEGKVYFHRNSGLRVVTESYLYNRDTAENISAWVMEIEERASKKGFVFTDQTELFLQLDGNNCNYYFVDHGVRTLFWLDAYDTSALGMLPVVSSSHLKTLLEAQYWSHIENFCMHSGGLPLNTIDDLIATLSHALLDNLTSTQSTFPFNSADCEKFRSLLISLRERINDGRTVCIVGRLWSMIMYARYETHYGEEQSRLSREISIIAKEDQEIQWSKPLISLLSLRAADQYLVHLEGLFIDEFVYGSAWDAFMASCMKGWQRSSLNSAALLLLHILCFFLPVSPLLAYVSGSLACLSLLTSVLLIHRHEELDMAGAAPAHAYLDEIRSKYFGMQGAAFAYALPKAFFLYSIIAFVSQWGLIVCQHICLPYASFCIGFMFLALIAFQYTTSRIQLPRPSFRVRLFRSSKEENMV